MGSPLKQTVVSPLPEIQVADEPINRIESPDSIPLHAFPLPLPSDHWEKACCEGGDEEREQALYKKVIYIPDTTEPSSRRQKARNYAKGGSPCPERLPGEIREEQRQEHVEDRRISNRDKVCYQWYSKYEVKECLASYKREWKYCFEFGVILTSHYLFWENIVWGILMGAWLEQQTRGRVGSVEVFSSYLLCGTAFVLLGGQALLIVGVSAPAVIFVIAVSDVSDKLLIEFLPWMGWVGIWSSVVLMILAASGACRFTRRRITFFTWEAIQIFIGMTFIWNAVEEIVHFFSNDVSLDSSILSLWLATSSSMVSAFLSQAGRFRLFNRKLCRVVGNCALPITLLLFTSVAFLPKLDRPWLQRVVFPVTGFRTDGITELGSLVRLKSIPIWAIFLAIIPGSLLASMIFVDHSATSLLIDDKAGLNMNTSKSRSWDVIIIALLVLVCGIFGLPFCYGLYFQQLNFKYFSLYVCIQSLKHVHALTQPKNADVESQEEFQNEIRVQRISGLIASLLSGLPLVPGLSWITAKIPFAVVAGLFLELALQTFKPLRFLEYTKLLLTDNPPLHSSRHGSSTGAVGQYTFIQFACTLIIFATSKTPAAILFPLFIILMMWSRHCPLRTVFTTQGLDKFDGKLLNDEPKNNQMTDIRIVNSQALTHITQPNPRRTNNAHRAAVIEDRTSGSPLPWKSPTLLPTTSTRRLKERSRRRNKRKRPTTSIHSSQEPDNRDVNLHRVVLPVPCRYQVKKATDFASKEEESSYSFSASKSIVRQLSPQLILKRKKNSPIEMHSNLLYDPGWDEPYVTANCSRSLPAGPESKYLSTQCTLNPQVTEKCRQDCGVSREPNKRPCLEGTDDDDDEETRMKMGNRQGVGSCIKRSDSRPPSSSSLASSPSQTYGNNIVGNESKKSVAKIRKREGVDVVELRALPRPSKHDVYPSNTNNRSIVDERLQTKKKFSSNTNAESSRRARMVLNQSIWPSNKPMPSTK
eukprot:Gb_28336 [translate_table: standard]